MFFKKIIFQNRYVELETPPFMEKTILNFHFDYLNTSLTVMCCAFAANNLYCAGASVLDTRPLLFCL